ncbi:17241_t:CDS:1, partial [Gigaspora rosea]
MEKEIDTIIFSMLELKKKAKTLDQTPSSPSKETVCTSCFNLIKNCESAFTKFNKGLSLVENIKKLQKDVNDTNAKYLTQNTKLIAMQDKYEPNNDSFFFYEY